MEIRDKMRSAGLKVTPQRLLIYGVAQELEHGTMDEIIAQTQGSNPFITISTIYRVLNSFCESNLLNKVSHPNGKIYYDINVHDHHHIVDSQQRLIDIDDPELTRFIQQRVSGKIKDNEQIERISIQITTSERVKRQ